MHMRVDRARRSARPPDTGAARYGSPVRVANVVLLRGINVGGKNKLPMADLRSALHAAGYANLETYIQSGNVVLDAESGGADLEAELEAVLRQCFGFPIAVVTRSAVEYRHVVASAPPGFGSQPDVFHSDVVFLKSPLTADEAMVVLTCRPGVDEAWAGPGAVYFRRLSERRTESRLSKVTGTPQYKLMTIRNWATTTKLLGLLDARTG
jgi:uncharacterized protein (DUF1697 family)